MQKNNVTNVPCIEKCFFLWWYHLMSHHNLGNYMDIKEKNNYTSHHPSMHLPHAIGKGGMCSLKVLTYLDSQGFFQPKPLKLATLAIIVHHGKSKIFKPSELSAKKTAWWLNPPTNSGSFAHLSKHSTEKLLQATSDNKTSAPKQSWRSATPGSSHVLPVMAMSWKGGSSGITSFLVNVSVHCIQYVTHTTRKHTEYVSLTYTYTTPSPRAKSTIFCGLRWPGDKCKDKWRFIFFFLGKVTCCKKTAGHWGSSYNPFGSKDLIHNFSFSEFSSALIYRNSLQKVFALMQFSW